MDVKMKHRHAIKAVSLKTGLSPHVIRVWERRYKAVEPARSDTNRRLYSDEDIERLYLLRKATQAGESIGQIAGLSTVELRKMVSTGIGRPPSIVKEYAQGDQAGDPEQYLQACVDAVSRLDAEELEYHLLQASSKLSRPVLLGDVLEPLMHKIGDMWRDGALTTVHEHLASAVVRSFLGGILQSEHRSEAAPVLIATTPAGQLHEFGALMAAIAASSVGWRVIYLGPDSPAEDIARAARQSRARAVALSIVHPPDDPHVGQEIAKLDRLLGGDATLFIGGRGHAGYRDVIESIGAKFMTDLGQFQTALESIQLSRRLI